MPIVWRYVTKIYLKIFSLCFITLFGLGFLINHKKVATLIVAGATYNQALLLFLCILTINLPQAIGISSGIASFLTTYKFKSSGELTSLKASGFSFLKIFAPLPFFAAILLLVNLFLAAEGVPYTKLLVSKLHLESQAINPLVLLKKTSLPLLKDYHIEMDINSKGSEAKNVLLINFLETEGRFTLFLADSLSYTDKTLVGDHCSMISYPVSKTGEFNHLLIDNQERISSPESVFISLLNRPSRATNQSVYSLHALTHLPLAETQEELLRRFAHILYPLFFTLIGLTGALFRRTA